MANNKGVPGLFYMRMQERKQRLSSVWTKRKQRKDDEVADAKQRKTIFRLICKICEQ